VYVNTVVNDAPVTALEAKVKGVNSEIEAGNVRATTYFHYAMHLTSMLVGQLSQIYEGTEMAGNIQALLEGVNIASTEAHIVFTGIKAAEAFGVGNIAQGAFLLSIAGMMQVMLARQLQIKIEAESAKREAERAKNFFSQYT
jgi:hypothetical protein